jgi:recombinational DNA repair protein RecT
MSEMQQQAPRKSVRAQMAEAFASAEMQAALAVCPPWLDRTRFAAQACADAADPTLASVPLAELVRGYLRIARMGLEPGETKHVARVPRGNTLDVQVQWQGLHFLFRQGGWEVSAHLVVWGDDIELREVGPDEFEVVRHTYDPFGRTVAPPDGKQTPGTIRGAYVKGINQHTGEVRFRMVPAERLERARKAAKTQSIWTSDYAQMAAKTAMHQAAARRWFPLASDVQSALTLAQELDLPPQHALAVERKPVSIGIASRVVPQLEAVQQVAVQPEAEPEQVPLFDAQPE